MLTGSEVVAGSLFDRAMQNSIDVVPTTSPCHHSLMFPHQRAAIRATFEYFTDPDAFCATCSTSKIAPASASSSSSSLFSVAFDDDYDEDDCFTDDDDDAPSKQKSVASSSGQKRRKAPKKAAAPPEVASMPYAIAYQEKTRRLSAKMRITPAGGKTWILFHIAVRLGFKVLLVTNSITNANQALVDLLENTAVTSIGEVVLIRPDGAEDIKGTEDDCVFNEKYKDFIMNKTRWEPASEFSSYRQLLDRGGIAICDAFMIKAHENASSQRRDLQTAIYRTSWDLLLVDETDTTATEQGRTAARYGISRYLGMKLGTRRYVLDYKLALYVSGTWYRSDRDGDDFLANECGPQLLTVPSRMIEDRGMLGSSIYNIVRCERDPVLDVNIDKVLSAVDTDTNQRIRLLTPSKLRCIFKLVHFFTTFNMKIIVFTKRRAHAALLASIFPGCHCVDGEFNKDDSTRETIAQNFCSYGLDFSNVLVTTTVFSIGKNMKPCQVVIQGCALGKSGKQTRQRFARCHRLDPLVSEQNELKKCHCFDILDEQEEPFTHNLLDGVVNTIAPDGHPAFTQDRYQLLVADGYRDRMRFWSSAQLMKCVEKELDIHFPSRLKLPNPFDEKQTVDFVLFELAITNPRLDVQMKEVTQTTTPSSSAPSGSHIIVPTTTAAGKRSASPAAAGARKRAKSGTGPTNRALKLLTKSRGSAPVELYRPAPPLQGADAAFKERQQLMLAASSSSASSSSSSALTRASTSTTKTATTTTATTPAIVPHSNMEVYKVLKPPDIDSYDEFVSHYKTVSADIKAMFSMLFEEINNERKKNTAEAKENSKVIQAFARIDLSSHLAEQEDAA